MVGGVAGTCLCEAHWLSAGGRSERCHCPGHEGRLHLGGGRQRHQPTLPHDRESKVSEKTVLFTCCPYFICTFCIHVITSMSRLLLPQESKDEEQLSRICPSWRKFCALTDLLEYSLSEVAEWLPRKKFASFTGNEMTALIKALFEDTPKRHGILTSILEMST